jgi:ABC-type branched-subunit amino acid transport system ATPase component
VEAAPVLEMRGITKRFPGVVADDHVDFDLVQGEVHALLGENGAGKSTLMNILYGLYRPDEGEILLNGQRVTFNSAKDAIDRGIGMVHQHFMLIPVMTVAENIVLEVEPTKAGVLLDYDTAVERVSELSTRFGLVVDPRAKVESISVGQQQRVEILKALYRGAKLLILDEPDRRPHPAGVGRAVRDRQEPPSGGHVDHLHQPQAEGGARDRGPDHGPAAGQEDRHDPARRRDRGHPRADDGGPRGAAAGREEGARCRRRPARGA